MRNRFTFTSAAVLAGLGAVAAPAAGQDQDVPRRAIPQPRADLWTPAPVQPIDPQPIDPAQLFGYPRAIDPLAIPDAKPFAVDTPRTFWAPFPTPVDPAPLQGQPRAVDPFALPDGKPFEPYAPLGLWAAPMDPPLYARPYGFDGLAVPDAHTYEIRPLLRAWPPIEAPETPQLPTGALETPFDLPALPPGLPSNLMGQDPADSLYVAARTALSRGEHERAAALFREIRIQFAGSAHAPDAYYWEAFALYRRGGADDLRAALEVLDLQRERHPDAAMRGDAPSLTVRINGALAQQGDVRAAETVARVAAVAPGRTATRGSTVVVDTTGRVSVAFPDTVIRFEREAQVYELRGALDMQARADAARRQSETMYLQMGTLRAELDAARSEYDAALRLYPEAIRLGTTFNNPNCPRNDQETRVAALNALVQMDAEGAVPVLARVLAQRDECSPPLRRRAIFLLSQTQSRETEDLILSAVQNDPDIEVRRQAVLYLSRVPTERSVQTLQQIVLTADDATIQQRAVAALAVHELADSRRVLHRFIERADAPERVRVTAVQQLTRNASDADIAFLRQSYGRQESRDVKDAILAAVAQAGTPQDRTWLVRVARDEAEPVYLRKKAIFWAGRHGTPLEQLTGLYDQLEAAELREQLILALGSRNEPAAFGSLERIARTETNPTLQARATFWFGRADADLNALLRLYNDVPVRQVREQLIAAFAQRYEPAALDRLIQIARAEEDLALRRAAITWLGRSDDPRALQALLELIER